MPCRSGLDLRCVKVFPSEMTVVERRPFPRHKGTGIWLAIFLCSAGAACREGVKGGLAEALCKLLSKKEVHYKMLSSVVWLPAKPFAFFTTAEGFLSFPQVGLSELFRNAASVAS